MSYITLHDVICNFTQCHVLPYMKSYYPTHFLQSAPKSLADCLAALLKLPCLIQFPAAAPAQC